MKVQSELIAYADCFSGVSGDMFLGALLDAGLPEKTLRNSIKKIDLSGYEIEICNNPGVIKSTKLTVHVTEKQPHRTWKDIQGLINQSALSETVKNTSHTIFSKLTEAEAAVHGCSPEDVHFHEVGGVDSIIDIIGAAIGLEHFNLSELHCSALPMPSGWVNCQHGRLPLPTPAVCELLKGIPTYGVSLDTELVTPTGAAIIAATTKKYGVMPPMNLAQIGYGAGSKTLPSKQPNLFRFIIGKNHNVSEHQEVMVTETNLDDWSPEGYPHLCEKLFSHGALDVVLTPVQMKKGRPGFVIQVISSAADAPHLQQILLSETSAIGVRYRKEARWTLPRRIEILDTPWGTVKIKIITTPRGTRVTPEYEDCRKLAEENNTPLSEIYAYVQQQHNN